MQNNTQTSEVSHLSRFLRQRGLVRLVDVRDAGFHPEVLRRMVVGGDVNRVGRGLYRLVDQDDAGLEAAVVCVAQPSAVLALLSALFYHGIGTQFPHEVWIQLPRGRRVPHLPEVNIRAFRVTEDSLSTGVQELAIAGVKTRITTPARTVADCFKFRSTVGLDVALEALKEGWKDSRFTLSELREQATVCRIQSVMQPYMEGLTG